MTEIVPKSLIFASLFSQMKELSLLPSFNLLILLLTNQMASLSFQSIEVFHDFRMADEKIFFDEGALSIVDSWLGEKKDAGKKSIKSASSSGTSVPVSKIGIIDIYTCIYLFMYA